MLADREHIEPDLVGPPGDLTIAWIRSASRGVYPATGSRVMSLTEKIPNCMCALSLCPQQ
jgi:hypothetical protein